MRIKSFLFSLLGVACLVSWGSGASPLPAKALPPELKKLHALLVFDTDSNLVDSLRIDQGRVKDLLFETIPTSRITTHSLTGKTVTRERILEWVRTVKVASDEGLLIYYGGHGATDQERGHLLQLRHGPPLVRSELRQALEAKKAGVAILLTDCCATLIKSPPVPKAPTVEAIPAPGAAGPKPIHPTVSSLFYRTRGIVDITAATDNAAWGDDEEGGVFTRTFCSVIRTPVKDLDRDRDGLVTWQEFFPKLQNETQLAFVSWSRSMRLRGEKIEATVQRPKAFALAKVAQPSDSGSVPPIGSASNPPPLPEKAYAVISLHNRADKNLTYRYRWSTEAESAWKRGELKANGREVLFTEVNGPIGDSFLLLIEFDGRKGTGQLVPRVWKGKGTPGFADGELATIRSR